jgi:chorismate mutase
MVGGLEEERKAIDEIDSEIVKLLLRRELIVKKLGEIKQINKLPLRDIQREESIILSACKYLDEALVRDVYSVLFNHSEKIMKNI